MSKPKIIFIGNYKIWIIGKGKIKIEDLHPEIEKSDEETETLLYKIGKYIKDEGLEAEIGFIKDAGDGWKD
jgi:hypothetical protein